MARPETWERVRKYFRPDSKVDQWGNPDEISDAHLLRLYDFRHYIGCPIFVTAGVKTAGHSKGSYHYTKKDSAGRVLQVACATDIVIPEYPETPFDLILDAARFGFTGIGYYPHWRWNGISVGGLHLDSRPQGLDEDGTVNYKHSRWMGVMNEQGKQVYIELNFQNVLKYSKYAFDNGLGEDSLH